MRKFTGSKSVLLAAVAVVSGLVAAGAHAQVTVDGTLSPTEQALYGTAKALQTNNTGFGNNASELNALYTYIDNATRKLNVFIAGNAESNNNKLVLFFDTKAGGQNTMLGTNPNVNFNNLNTKYGPNGAAPGMTFDTGFNADYWFSISRDGNNPNETGTAYVDFAELLTTGGGAGGFAGSIAVPKTPLPQQGAGTVGGQNGSPVFKYGYNDANLAGVSGDASLPLSGDPSTVSTGAEYEFDLDTLGVNGDFKILALVNGSNHDYMSNQTLPGLPALTTNLGGDGTGTFTGNVSAINFNAYAGDQFLTVSGPVAPTYTWNVTTGGNWNTPGNWGGSVVPNGASVRATLGPIITAAQTVTLDVPVTLRSLTFNNANSYTVAGTSTLSINGDAGVAALEVIAGSHTISAPVALLGTTRADIAPGSTLTLSGTVTAAGQNLFNIGGGTLVLPATNMNSLTVSAGTVKVTGSGNSIVKGATVAAGSTLDLTGSTLIVNYDAGFSPLADIKAAIASAALSSTTIAGSNAAIGYLDTAVTGQTEFNGATALDADNLIIRATLQGDATLDRAVNFDDLLKLAAAYNQTGQEWYNGDFTGDGTVNFDDLLKLAANYNTSVTGSFGGDWALAQSAVPEPTSLLAIGGAGLVALRRRRRA
jgi:hypothetical protein